MPQLREGYVPRRHNLDNGRKAFKGAPPAGHVIQVPRNPPPLQLWSLVLLHDTLTNNMGKNDKKGADKGGKGKADKGKDAKDSGGKSKGAQSINVRHILVSFTQVFTN